MDSQSGNPEYLLSSVKNALRILRSFSMDKPELKVSDLAASLGLGKSTVSRLVGTLASEGFVTKDPETQKYRLGVSILGLYSILTSNLEINQESMPILQKLVEDIGETAHIATLVGLETVYLNKVECNHPVRILSHVGRRNPAYCTSSGKVMLAYQPDEVVEQVIENGLIQYTKNTITDPDTLRTALKTIREQGYAVSVEELLEGVVTIAAPIRDHTGKVNYAITMTGPIQRIRSHNISVYRGKIIKAAKEISERLGYWK
ncbi:IclR family transcriptional regulator [Fodinisporobacter ferrooxydans]|uniref:IclR family transcriptional regulator n=1 Tax=Fodinisporobacter ferrooxydans TaxID=2901836 RepID=A0ABY4CI15_9BACL|nr:IclR family transcriptional regulator [Alicyclobacillaceae bacterium MYW30-H2]